MLRVQPVIHPGQQWRTLFWLYHPPSNESIMWRHWKMLPKQLKRWITERYSHRGTFRTQEVKGAKGLQNLCAVVKRDSFRSFKTCSSGKAYTAQHKTSECTFVCARLLWIVVLELTVLSPSTCEEWISAEWQIIVCLSYCPHHMRRMAPSAARIAVRPPVCVCVRGRVCVHKHGMKASDPGDNGI